MILIALIKNLRARSMPQTKSPSASSVAFTTRSVSLSSFVSWAQTSAVDMRVSRTSWIIVLVSGSCNVDGSLDKTISAIWMYCRWEIYWTRQVFNRLASASPRSALSSFHINCKSCSSTVEFHQHSSCIPGRILNNSDRLMDSWLRCLKVLTFGMRFEHSRRRSNNKDKLHKEKSIKALARSRKLTCEHHVAFRTVRPDANSTHEALKSWCVLLSCHQNHPQVVQNIEVQRTKPQSFFQTRNRLRGERKRVWWNKSMRKIIGDRS